MDDIKVGFVGYRGMVGQVLWQRMLQENDMIQLREKRLVMVPFSSSKDQIGQKVQFFNEPVCDSTQVEQLAECDIIMTCQGSSWSKEMYPQLLKIGWNGYFLDASSAFRMNDDAIIVLDPINRKQINEALDDGIRIYCGGNCTTSLMMLALHGLFKAGLAKSIFVATYQAASGAGAKSMKELIDQSRILSSIASEEGGGILKQEELIKKIFNSNVQAIPTKQFGVPLAFNLIPWIDSMILDGRTREEWKGETETNKILGLSERSAIPVESICVRVPVMRCHSQVIRVELKDNIHIESLGYMLDIANSWVHVVPSDERSVRSRLTPAAVTGKLDINVGRLHKAQSGRGKVLKLFTVGDQLLWGAAEPVRRMLNILLERLC